MKFEDEVELGFRGSPVDNSLFIYHKSNIHVIFLIHVDDILGTGTHKELIFSLIKKLQEEFKQKALGDLSYFLGIQAH